MTLMELEKALEDKKLDLAKVRADVEHSKCKSFIEYSRNLITVYEFDIIAIEIDIKNFNSWLESYT